MALCAMYCMCWPSVFICALRAHAWGVVILRRTHMYVVCITGRKRHVHGASRPTIQAASMDAPTSPSRHLLMWPGSTTRKRLL